MVAPHPDLQRRIDNTKNIAEANKYHLVPGLYTKYPQDYIDLDTYSVLDRVKPWIELPSITLSQDYSGPQPLYPKFSTLQRIVPTVRDKILIVCIDFPDVPATTTTSAIYDRFFSTTALGGKTLINYYKENSYNKYIPEGIVHGWYRIPHPLTYYSNGQYGLGNPPNLITLFEDVVNIIKGDTTIDWSYIDADNNNEINYIVIVHSGYEAARTGNKNDIWSSALGYGMYIGTTGKMSTGVKITSTVRAWNIAFVSEHSSSIKADSTVIGTYCHEFGHLLGLPDLYKGSSTANAVLGYYSLMAGGNWLGDGATPGHLDAYSKYNLSFTNTLINQSGINQVINDAETNDRNYLYTTRNYNIPGPYPDSVTYEYFIIENRQNKLFDSYLPSNGIFIWHAKETFAINSISTSVELKQADGLKDLENNRNYGDTGDSYPGSTNNRSFGKSTNPNTTLYDGTVQNIEITNISDPSSAMTMTATLPIGSVRFHTSPGGTDIWVGTTKLGTTDSGGILLISNLLTGPLSYVAKKTGYYDSSTQSVTVVENITIDTPLVILTSIVITGSLSISSYPSGAKIYIDSIEQIGRLTPATISGLSLSPPSHTYKLMLTGYEDSIGMFDIIVGQTTTIPTITLTPISPTTGTIIITSIPSGAKIYIGNIEQVGRLTPSTIANLSQGTHTYKLTLTGYQDKFGSFDILAGEIKMIDAGNLTPIIVQAGFGPVGMIMMVGLVVGAIYSTKTETSKVKAKI